MGRPKIVDVSEKERHKRTTLEPKRKRRAILRDDKEENIMKLEKCSQEKAREKIKSRLKTKRIAASHHATAVRRATKEGHEPPTFVRKRPAARRQPNDAPEESAAVVAGLDLERVRCGGGQGGGGEQHGWLGMAEAPCGGPGGPLLGRCGGVGGGRGEGGGREGGGRREGGGGA